MASASTPENEHQYIDEATGKPIVYADNVPELLRGDLTLTPEEEALAPELKQVFNSSPIHLAERGADDWNLWVKANERKWLDRKILAEKISVSLKIWEDLLEFGRYQPRKDAVQYTIVKPNFEGFVFPYPVSFERAIFKNGANFTSAQFCEGVSFSGVKFDCEVWFDQTIFRRYALFRDARFGVKFSALGTKFSGRADFETTHWHKGADFSGACFGAPAIFKGAEFHDKAVFRRHVRFSKEAIFAGVKFKGPADFRGANFLAAASFEKVEFHRLVRFVRAKFMEKVTFGKDVSFIEPAWFTRVIFSGAAVFKGTEFNQAARFGGSSFLAQAKFEDASFKENSDFRRSEFSDRADFVKAEFGDTAEFSETKFRGFVNFGGARFSRSLKLLGSFFFGKASFVNTKFDGQVELDNAAFGVVPEDGVVRDPEIVPNFIGARFEEPPNLSFTKIPAPPRPKSSGVVSSIRRFWCGPTEKERVGDKRAAAKFRRLQTLALLSHNHQAEKRFFREELICRLGYETRTRREVSMINLFDFISKCGLSFWRPIGWWLVSSGFFGFLYWLCSDRFGVGGLMRDGAHLLNYTLANSFPIVGVFSASNSRAVDALFGEANGVPFIVGLLAGGHNIVSTVFLFFALLAVRNYFKLG